MTSEEFDPAHLIDHLVYGVLDLKAAVDRIADATGVRPVEGGRHVGRGTRNYLLGLSPTSYLEVIALDRENPVAEGKRVSFGLDVLDQDRLITWAIHPTDAGAALKASRQYGADHGDLFAMSRVDAKGNELSWRLASADAAPYDGLAPFIIDWGTSPHPAGGVPAARLETLTLSSPAHEQVTELLRALGVQITVGDGPAGLHATLRGPAGTVEI
ncbi:glyoxalase-like protein [Antricoccus suffuscus]|uniref:Glyoxalase-like protein n=1 Tax=Antricoccus suffuscus TaxID=1629062 RepID=A0A2T0ZYA8_9ACTN|nr:VOC family protein [Antricoccus suffuscus]PRZ41227.1 glyoxalase-like protein [Antricoccus suffuscus]